MKMSFTNTKAILVKAVEVVVFIFAVFGGFLSGIAPPEEANAKFSVGVSSFFALVILLLIAAISSNTPVRKYKKWWLTAASAAFLFALAAAFSYKSNLERFTFPYPPESLKAEYIAGTEMTAEAKDYQEKSGRTTSGVVAAFGGLSNREKVWSSSSIQKAQRILIVNYVALVLSFSISIFCLTEGVLGKSRQRKTKQISAPATSAD
jgi:hypothetical protein